ncbi:MAG: hypothetical protein HUJ58_00330 [Erysipelotrichaceae bacterium]|nr:hypothetical protein [Erysipelotrichaceae bacterium]
MKYKMRALGFTSLLTVSVYAVVTAACLGMGVSYLVNGGSAFKVVPLLMVWPLIRNMYLIMNRYIQIEEDKITFHVEQAHTNLLSAPKFFVEEITTDELKFYGTYSDLYIKNIRKADRKKGSKEHYDIITVKDGEIEIPVGILKFGQPLAFVTKTRDSYVYDDAMFSEDQMAYFFYCVQQQCNIAPTGSVEASPFSTGSSSASVFVRVALMAVVFGAIGLCLPFAETLINKVPFTLFAYSNLQLVYVFVFEMGVLASCVSLAAYKNVIGNDKEKSSLYNYTMGIAAAICFAVSILLVVIACF